MFRKLPLLLLMWVSQAIPFALLLPLTLSESVSEYFEALGDGEVWVVIACFAGTITALQAVFVWPVRRPAPGRRGRALWPSIAAAGLCAGLLTGALVAAIADAAWLAKATETRFRDGTWVTWGVVAVGVTAWIAWTPLLLAFCSRQGRETALGRLSARLFLGTVVEAIAIVPLDMMVRRKTSCHCEQGTFVALVACCGVGWFAFGPAVFLPLLARRRKRWYAGHCDACGYDMVGCPNADRCPECGAGWARPGGAVTP